MMNLNSKRGYESTDSSTSTPKQQTKPAGAPVAVNVDDGEMSDAGGMGEQKEAHQSGNEEVIHIHKRPKVSPESPLLQQRSPNQPAVQSPHSTSATITPRHHAHSYGNGQPTHIHSPPYQPMASMQLQSPTARPQQQQQSILQSMNSPSQATHMTSSPPTASSPQFPYTLPPVSAIRSPRRAVVCASLESTAAASSALTQTAIHPAILHSLSIRLQAMNDEEAEIVLHRLQQLAQHIEQQNLRNKLQHQQRCTTQQTLITQAASPQRVGQQGGGTASPMPTLGSASSVDSGSTSNTTSPNISPAVRAATPPGPPSPAFTANSPGGARTHAKLSPATSGLQATHTPPHISLKSPTHGSHPPLHPLDKTTLSSSTYVQMLLNRGGSSIRLANTSAPSSSATTSFTFPSTAGSSSTSSTTSSTSSSSTLPPVSPPVMVRGVSDDASGTPVSGLMMLIEALPGKTTQVDSPNSTLHGGTNVMEIDPIGPPSFLTDFHSSTSSATSQKKDAAIQSGTSHLSRMIGLPPPNALRRSTSF